jgi:hypothetical protein
MTRWEERHQAALREGGVALVALASEAVKSHWRPLV